MNTPRRARVDQWTPAEAAIAQALQVVEQAGADVRLTDACNLLWAAREAVADFVDGIDRRRLAIFADQAATWHPMSALPDDVLHADIVAKTWNAATDQFEFRRFANCAWMSGSWGGIPAGWRPVGWMPIPALPEQEPKA